MNKFKQHLAKILMIAGLVAVSADSLEAAIMSRSTRDRITTLKSTALINGSEITADCLIKSGASKELREHLASIQLGHIPDPLGEIVINKDEMLRRLGSLASNLAIPDKITIRRDGSILKGTTVSERISAICRASGEEDLRIDLSRVPTNMVLPGTLQSWDVKTNSDNTLGMRLFVLTAQTAGGPFRQLIQVRVSRVIEAAQLTRLSRPGETIDNSMIRRKEVEVKSDQSNIPLTYREATGKCLGRFKSAGTILRSSDLSDGSRNLCKSNGRSNKDNDSKRFTRPGDRDSWLIKPGESVDFHVNSGALSLKIPARAVQGGGEGDEIMLINLQNQRRIRGIIKDKGRVEYAQN